MILGGKAGTVRVIELLDAADKRRQLKSGGCEGKREK